MRPRRGKPPVGVRPTTSKVLESLMAILAPRSEDARALDLFAGTGQVGMRLLDQGARELTFVEADSKVAEALRRSIKDSEHGPACRLLVGKIPKILEKLEDTYDLMLADPPYDWPEPASLLPALARWAKHDSLAVVEHHHKTPYTESAGWTLCRQEKYGESRLSFFCFARPSHLLVEPLHEHADHHHDRDEDRDGCGIVRE